MTHLHNTRPPPFEVFMASLVVSLTPGEYEMTRFAYICSKYGHQGQVRDDGTRYFDHPKAVAWIYFDEYGGRDARLVSNCLLHDIKEDSYLLSGYRLSLNFGKDIALDVSSMTKLPDGKESTTAYLQRIIDQGPWAIAAKLFDRLHNCRTLGGCTPEKQLSQIEETRKYHLPLLIPVLRSHGGEWEKMTSFLEEKINEALASY